MSIIIFELFSKIRALLLWLVGIMNFKHVIRFRTKCSTSKSFNKINVAKIQLIFTWHSVVWFQLSTSAIRVPGVYSIHEQSLSKNPHLQLATTYFHKNMGLLRSHMILHLK